MSAVHKWKKGQSGNPTGLRNDGQPRKKRRKIPPGLSRDEMTALARSHGPEMIERLLFWSRSKNARMSVRATQLMIERGYGTPAPSDRVETTMLLRGGADGQDKIELVFVTPIVTEDEGPRVVH